jgi:PAS domain S-box-containing protein
MESLALRLLEKFTADRQKIERYSAIAETCPLPAFVSGSDGRTILYVNPAYTAMTGLQLADVQDGNWIKSIHPDDRAEAQASWDTFTKTRQPAARYHRYVHKNGTVTPAMRIVSCVENNGFVGFIIPQCGVPTCPLRQLNSPIWQLAGLIDVQPAPA